MVQEVSFKRFLIWNSGFLPVRWSRTIYANLKEGIMGNIHVKLYEIRRCRLKDISYLELWQPLCSVDWYHLCNIGRHHGEQSCKIILNLDQWLRRKSHLKVFIIWRSGCPFVQRSVTICAILVVRVSRGTIL